MSTLKHDRHQKRHHHRSSYRLPSRRIRSWLKAAAGLGTALVLLNLLLSGSNIGQTEEWIGKKVLFVTAHPDDEVMFFSPAILALASIGAQIYSLCLSIGDADNLGSTRRRELARSYTTLGVPVEHVQNVDDPRLQDGMTIDWSSDAIIEYISHQAKQNGPFDAIVTFDDKGISGHPNHRGCYQAIKVLSQSSAFSQKTNFYILHTVPLSVKYLSLPMAIARQLLSANTSHQLRFLSSIKGYFIAIQAMMAHQSQLVWFRYLYIMSSVYMYNNELIKLNE